MDIHKVFLNRRFSSKETRDVIDRRGLLYVLGKPARVKMNKENIEEIKDHDTYDICWHPLHRIRNGMTGEFSRTYSLVFRRVLLLK